MAIGVGIMPAGRPACENCRFWRVEMEDDEDGEISGCCRRYPPVLDPVWTMHYMSAPDSDGTGCEGTHRAWENPITKSYYWCGEYNGKS